MLQEPENGGGVQPNRIPSLQPNHDNKPKSSSEEPINQLPSSIPGELKVLMINSSCPNPKLHVTNSVSRDKRSSHSHYLPLYIAAQSGDWKTAKSFIEHNPKALTDRIASNAQTVLHVAALCCHWGFVLGLLELLSPGSIAVQDEHGMTVLRFVARGGSLKTAKALVRKNENSRR
ncbi:hypothetical protein QYF36_003634 [Acer negundo]|nr:hypothetical protein QYF36_003634 [Acer negundo]